MNKAAYDVLLHILKHPSATQRELSSYTAYSLGKVNKSLAKLKEEAYLDLKGKATEKTLDEAHKKQPKNAIILAAGYGLRMIPLNLDTPKGLLKVKGETLVERLIGQLREVGIKEIFLVVGHLKEEYEFLMDDEDITLIVNPDYGQKNNLHSLIKVLPHIGNSYILPCDIRFEKNPFSQTELYSWYGVTKKEKKNSTVRINSKGELHRIGKNELGNAMVGISYLLEEDRTWFCNRIEEMAHLEQYNHSFWEEALMDKDKMRIWGKLFPLDDVFEFTSLEDLQHWQDDDEDFGNSALKMISSLLGVSPSSIRDIRPMESGMTNRSFVFTCKGQEYIMRVPGEGTEKLIDRNQERAVHKILKSAGLSKELIHIDSGTGYKLTKKLPNVRECDAKSPEDVKRCMKVLREFHNMDLRVDHEFDVFSVLEYYEKLWGGVDSYYRDYLTTKARVFELKDYIEDHIDRRTLCHIDAVSDNFLFYRDPDGDEESIVMIDWEYAAMQDPHIDLAMFSIYANYKQEEVDLLIDEYFEGKCDNAIRIKIYAYIALCGLLWSNWCEYKKMLGVDFGQYALNQYRYAKSYYKKVIESEAYKRWNSKKEGEAL